jgi:hypothetical protein
MNTPLITTIIPTFRRPRLLRRAIESVLGQTFQDFQVCIYDNASGDETASVVAEFSRRDPRVRYHCHAENIGSGANVNFGLARVDTPYFSFLSDDDLLLPAFYETALAGFREFPDAGFSAGSVIVMTESGEVLTVPLDLWDHVGYFPQPEGLLHLIDNKLPVWTSMLFRKAVTDAIGPVDLEVGAAADFDYQLQVASRSPFVVSRVPCGIFLTHAASYSAAPSVASFWPGWLRMVGNVEKNNGVPDKIKAQARRGLTLYIRKTLFSIGWKLIRSGDYADARRSAEVLRGHFGEIGRSFLLSTAAAVCAAGKLPGRCFSFAYDLALSLRRSLSGGREQLQEKYGGYAKWL